MTALLDIEDLQVTFPGHEAVRKLNLTLHAGETLALVGESGCGKSATALSLMRLLPPQAQIQGKILLDGNDILTFSDRQMRQLRGNTFSMIFQEPMTSLNPVMSIGQQIGESLKFHQGMNRRQARQRAIELLDLVKIPEPARRVDDYPHHLSGGQRQRVMIAMAVACKPRLLIADEPTTALDVTVQQQILSLLDSLRREFSMGLLLITHDLGLVSQWADRVAVMFGGRKVEEAETARLFAAPQHAYTRGLLGTSLHMGQDRHYSRHRLPEIVHQADSQGANFQLMTPETVPHRPVLQGDTPLLSVHNLHAQYNSARGRVAAVNGVSLDIRPGETIGLVGESGCGKSTLSKAILRLLPVSQGEIIFKGKTITHQQGAGLTDLRREMQMVFQDPFASLNPRYTVEETLELPLRVHRLGNRQWRQKTVTEMLDKVGLPRKSLARYPHQFSGGQRQRIGIARALVMRPSLVICDEPVSALDVSIQAQILNLLITLKSEMGLALLFISHDLAVVRYIADKVIVMQKGQFVEQGDQNTIWHRPQHAYTQQLIEAIPGLTPRLSAANNR